MEYVKNNEIVLNIGFDATSGLQAGQRVHRVQGPLRRRGARHHGARGPGDHVVAIYAAVQNGQGMATPGFAAGLYNTPLADLAQW
jgi:stringent starvation protein B